MTETAVESATPFQRFVLVAVADLTDQGEEAVHSYDVKRVCEEYSDTIEQELFGGVTRREVIAALSALSEVGVLEETTVSSPVGKGRPAYRLADEVDDVLDTLANDDTVGPVVVRLREQ